MKKIIALSTLFLALTASTAFAAGNKKPWDNGKLKVSENSRFLQHENGAPFFWLGETGWLLLSAPTAPRLPIIFSVCVRQDTIWCRYRSSTVSQPITITDRCPT